MAAYDIFSRHHPGMFDPRNRAFPGQLRRARDAALRYLEGVGDAEGHMRTLAIFTAGLADGHARVQAAYSGRNPMIWPGFSTGWRGDGLYVLDPVAGGPPRGAMLLSCDGRDARDVIKDFAFLVLPGRPDEAGQWWTLAPTLFERPRSPYENLPRACRFRHPEGRTTSHMLDWQIMPHEMIRARMQAALREPIGLTEPRPRIYRINLSSFSPDDLGRAAYLRLFAELESGIDRIRSGRAVVIDLRRNAGGSSSWSREVADRLWGVAAVRAARADYFRNTRIWWLADAGNIAHFRGAVERLRAEGRAEDATHYDGIASSLAAARRRGRRFHIEDFGATLARGAVQAEPRQLPPVYVIIDGGCASACLDALDLFTRFPNVKLIGAPTSADSTYLDIRFEPLPSGRGVVVLPTKIWVGRPRASGAVYRPHIPVNDLDWTTATLLDHVERDLGGDGSD